MKLGIICSTEHPICFVKQPSEYIKNEIEGCSLAWGNLARDVAHLRVRRIWLRDWLGVKAWPTSRGRLADLLITTDIRLGSWWCHSRSQVKTDCCHHICKDPSCPLKSHLTETCMDFFSPTFRLEFNWLHESHWNMHNVTLCVFKGAISVRSRFSNFLFKRTLIFMNMPLPILSLSPWPLVNLFWLTRQQGAWGLRPQGLGGEMSGSLHTSGEAPQGTATQISLPRQHSMVWHMKNQPARKSAI